eukprot:GEMP01062726.1.p1 GENE.GEMP01062726.1~~GEMP01062726.1.p1  ORF type:complete len:156 (+),score=30.03 GEMP01062726.1:109-576(+)
MAKHVAPSKGVGLPNMPNSPEEINRIKGERELMKACYDKNAEAILSSTSNPNAEMSGGTSPFHIACAMGLGMDVLKHMVDGGANINITNNLRLTPLHIAVLNGHAVVVKFLVDRGANTDVKSVAGETPADYAEIYGFPNLQNDLRGSVKISRIPS